MPIVAKTGNEAMAEAMRQINPDVVAAYPITPATEIVMIFAENAQEAYDNLIQAVRIAEDPSVKLPTMVTTDGFIISHCMERIETLDDKTVKDFIGERKAEVSVLDINAPTTR